MKPNFSPSLFPLCVSVSLWFKFQICLARIRSRELELLEHQANHGLFTEFRYYPGKTNTLETFLSPLLAFIWTMSRGHEPRRSERDPPSPILQAFWTLRWALGALESHE